MEEDKDTLIKGLASWQAHQEGQLEALNLVVRCLVASAAPGGHVASRIEAELAQWRASSEQSPDTPPETLHGFDLVQQHIAAALRPNDPGPAH